MNSRSWACTHAEVKEPHVHVVAANAQLTTRLTRLFPCCNSHVHTPLSCTHTKQVHTHTHTHSPQCWLASPCVHVPLPRCAWHEAARCLPCQTAANGCMACVELEQAWRHSQGPVWLASRALVVVFAIFYRCMQLPGHRAEIATANQEVYAHKQHQDVAPLSQHASDLAKHQLFSRSHKATQTGLANYQLF